MNIFIQNLIQSIRSLRTLGWQVAISSVSLAVGIVCLTFSADWFWAETNYDSFRPNYKDIYFMHRADSTLKIGELSTRYSTNAHTYNGVLEMRKLAQNNSFKLGAYCFMESLHFGIQTFTASENDRKQMFWTLQMDTCAAEILGISALHGNIAEALSTSPDYIIITDKAAIEMFGRTDVVGEIIRHERLQKNRTIKAVCHAIKGNSNFKYDIIQPIDLHAYNLADDYNFASIIRTDNPKRCIEQLSNYKPTGDKHKYYYTDNTYLELKPLRTYPKLWSNEKGTQLQFTEVFFYQIIFTMIAILLIISAVINLIMVYTSICLSRIREYALRRSMGASTWQNIEWMLTGIFPTLLFGCLLSGVIMEWTTKFADIPWDTSHIFYFYTLVLASTFLLCIIGMAYPIYKMRRAYRASFLGHGDGGRSHLWLIIVQCAACAFLLFISLGMQRQISGMINADIGYEHKNMLRLVTANYNRHFLPEGFNAYYNFDHIFNDLPNEFLREGGATGIVDVMPMQTDLFNRVAIQSVIVLNEHDYPNRANLNLSEYFSEEAPLSMGFEVYYLELAFRAIDFFNIHTANGVKLLPENEHTDYLQVYLNSEAMKLFAPDGQLRSGYYTYCTVINDGTSNDGRLERHWEERRIRFQDVANLRTTDFFTADVPIMFVGVEELHKCAASKHDAIYIKYAEGRREEAEATVRKVLDKFDVPEDQYLLTTFDDYIAGVYKKETFIANLLTYLTVFSVVITLAGVFSMLLYSLRLRRRSMAIHRVMGATFKDIFMPTLRPYLIYATLGAVAAYFPAYILMRKWMEYFHYGETPGVGLMLSILGGMVLIITLIVWWQVSLCMKEKPVEILKPES